MNVNELQLAHHHHEELLREAENERLARRSREDSPPRQRAYRPGGLSLAGIRRAMGLWGRIGIPFFRA
jgi:hypothetical protein